MEYEPWVRVEFFAEASFRPAASLFLVFISVAWNAWDYYEHTNGKVKIQVKTVSSMTALFEEIELDARTGGGLFDGYYTSPVILGTTPAL